MRRHAAFLIIRGLISSGERAAGEPFDQTIVLLPVAGSTIMKLTGETAPLRVISPLIATVLLIGFVISLIVLVILWGKGYIEELAEKRGILAEKQQQCQNVEVTAIKVERLPDAIKVVMKNKKETTVHKFVFRITGEEKGEAYEALKPLKGLEVKEYTVKFPDPGRIKSLDAIPHLQVAIGNYVPCSGKTIKIKLD